MKRNSIERNSLSFIDLSKNKLEKHIDFCEYMKEYCERKSNDKKPYYFKKQIEITKRKLKQKLNK